MDLQVEQEVSELRKEIAEIRSELTLALSRISDKGHDYRLIGWWWIWILLIGFCC